MPGEYEAVHVADHEALIERRSRSLGGSRSAARAISGKIRRDQWTQVVFRKPRMPMSRRGPRR